MDPLSASRPDGSPPARPLPLISDEVHGWCVSLDVSPESCARLHETLAGDERARAARFRFEPDRRRLVVAHGVLRELLARYLETQPDRIRYVYNAFGKPDLGPEFGGRLKFNLSHSGDLAFVAVAADADVGVDLEHVRAPFDAAGIAERFFSAAESDYLNGLPSHLYPEAFLRCWTQKEAYVKASGEGLGALEEASTDAALAPVRARSWSLYTLQPAPDYIGALAIEGSGWHLTQRHWH